MSHKCRCETNQRKIESRIIQFQRFLLWYVKEKRESLRERERTTDSRDGNLEPPSPIFPGLTPKHFLSTEETSPSGKLRQLPSKSGRRVSSMFLVYPNPASEQGSIEGRGRREEGWIGSARVFPPIAPSNYSKSFHSRLHGWFLRSWKGEKKKRKGKERRKGKRIEQAFVSISIGKERKREEDRWNREWSRDLARKLGEPTWKGEEGGGGPSFINFWKRDASIDSVAAGRLVVTRAKSCDEAR